MDAVKKNSLKEKIDRLATGFAAITSIPVFGFIVKMVFDKIQEKGAEALGKRIEDILGINLKEAKKDIGDEILYGVAVSQLDELDQIEMDTFERDLRKGKYSKNIKDKEKDKEKAESLVLFVAKIVKTFERETKETTQTYKNIEEGLKHAKKFLEALLRNKDANVKETFKLRVAFLQGKNVFSLIKEKKKLNEFLKEAGDKIKETAQSVNAYYSKGMNNLNNGLGDLLGKAKAWRDKATKK